MRRLLVLMCLAGGLLSANEPEVLSVRHHCDTQRICRFDVTIRHHDTGWKHYVNRYEILDMTGKILATRVLYHPHVDEQPFTRSLGDVTIPKGVHRIRVRAHDLVHGYGSKEVIVSL